MEGDKEENDDAIAVQHDLTFDGHGHHGQGGPATAVCPAAPAPVHEEGCDSVGDDYVNEVDDDENGNATSVQHVSDSK